MNYTRPRVFRMTMLTKDFDVDWFPTVSNFLYGYLLWAKSTRNQNLSKLVLFMLGIHLHLLQLSPENSGTSISSLSFRLAYLDLVAKTLERTFAFSPGSSVGVCNNTRPEISDPKTRRSDPKFWISDPILRFRIGYPEKNFGFSDREFSKISTNPIRKSGDTIQKFDIRSKNPVIRYPTLNTPNLRSAFTKWRLVEPNPFFKKICCASYFIIIGSI